MSQDKLLIVGSFPSPDQKIYGGIAKSCKILIESETFKKYKIQTIDSSQSNPSPILIIRLINATTRILKLLYKLIFNKPKSILIFCSDGFSAVEKGLMIILSRLFNVRVLIFPRAGNLIKQVNNSKLFKALIKFMFSNANLFLSQGNKWAQFAEDILKLNTEKIKIAHNWTATDDLIKIGMSKKIDQNNTRLKLLFVGWLEKEKGVNEILQVLKRLNEKKYNFTMTFIGDGKMKTKATKFIQKNNLSEKVVIKGWLDRMDIYNYYKNSDIFLLPSWIEGMPNSLIEALASAIPTIVTPVGVIPDYLNDKENALFIPPKNVNALEEALKQLLNNLEIRKKLSKNGFLLAKSLFLTKTSLDRLSVIVSEQKD